MRVTSGKSRVRESRLPGSVRAKPNGRATRPSNSRHCNTILIADFRFASSGHEPSTSMICDRIISYVGKYFM
ncbi:MAG TPA: hypothetical protein DCF65_04305 [Chloroflexi bacterium]|nr:hypothetical protein [Chloroflexota bacterium]HAF18411.1 hypothetical protein [Chloroflexota bacterium]